MTADDILDLATVIPVVVIGDADDAVPLARELVAAGMPAIEITLRTPAALEAIANVAADVPLARLGAGTVLTPEQGEEALGAGAEFLVSPGITPALLDAGLPLLPGVATASEIMRVLERGVTAAKFFPAEASGGINALRAFAGPFPQLRFCPTGGIDAAKAPAYLALPNVACVGGSWMLTGSPGALGGPQAADGPDDEHERERDGDAVDEPGVDRAA